MTQQRLLEYPHQMGKLENQEKLHTQTAKLLEMVHSVSSFKRNWFKVAYQALQMIRLL